MTSPLQSALSRSAATASFQVAKPIFCLPPSTVFLHASLGRPPLLLPSSAQVRAMRGFWWSTRNACSIQRHLRLPIFSLMVQVLALCLTSLLVNLIGQYIFTFSVGACGGMCSASPPFWSFFKSRIRRVALL